MGARHSAWVPDRRSQQEQPSDVGYKWIFHVWARNIVVCILNFSQEVIWGNLYLRNFLTKHCQIFTTNSSLGLEPACQISSRSVHAEMFEKLALKRNAVAIFMKEQLDLLSKLGFIPHPSTAKYPVGSLLGCRANYPSTWITQDTSGLVTNLGA